MADSKSLIQCPICLHEYEKSQTSKHHLVPKSRGGKIVVPLCKACHCQIHAIYTERELERKFSTIEELVNAEEFQSWVKWIRKRKPRARIAVRTSKRKRR